MSAKNALSKMRINKVPADANILSSRFAFALKNPGTSNERYKARFIVQGHQDREKDVVLNRSQTVMRYSVKLLLCFASTNGFLIFSRDAKQAYLQIER